MVHATPKPIPRAFSRERKEYDKARHAALSAARKGTAWRKHSAWLYCQRQGSFIELFFVGHRGETKTSVRVVVKPMKLDSLFWKIGGLHDNERAPLSLRANGAFTCKGLPIREERIDDDPDPIESAAKLLALADAGAEAAMQKLGSMQFSKLLEVHAEACNRNAPAQFGPSYLTALILDERFPEARRIIHELKSGTMKSITNFYMHSAGPDDRRDFLDLALEYLSTV